MLTSISDDVNAGGPNTFATMDKNEDYVITKLEYVEYFESKKKVMYDKDGNELDYSRRYGLHDKNGDGRLDWDEFTGYKGVSPADRSIGVGTQRWGEDYGASSQEQHIGFHPRDKEQM